MKLSFEQLINSKSLVNYLKFIGHEFSKTEEAMLIYLKTMTTYEEKIHLFEEFIKNEEDTPLIQNIKKWISETRGKINWCIDPKNHPYEGSVCEDIEFDVMDEEIFAIVDEFEDKYPELEIDFDCVVFRGFYDAINFVKEFRNSHGLEHSQFYIRLNDWVDDDDDGPDVKCSQVTKILIDENYKILDIDFRYDVELNDDPLSYLMDENLIIPNSYRHGCCVKDSAGRYGVVDEKVYPEFKDLMKEKEPEYVDNITLVPVQFFDGINMQYTMITPMCLEILDIESIPNDIKLLSDILTGKYPIDFLVNIIKNHMWYDVERRSSTLFGSDSRTTLFIRDTFEDIYEEVSGFGNSPLYLNQFNLTDKSSEK